jgi:hypothetical protein
MPASRRTFPRTTAATKRRSTSSSGGSTARIGAANEAIRSLTRARRLGPRSPSSRLSPTSPSTRRMIASRARRRVCTAPSAGSEISATPCVALASATTGRLPMRNGASLMQTAISQRSRSRRSRAKSMASTPRLMSATAGSVRTGRRQETASDTRSASSPGSSSASASATSAAHPGAARTPSTSSSRSDNPTVRDVTWLKRSG